MPEAASAIVNVAVPILVELIWKVALPEPSVTAVAGEILSIAGERFLFEVTDTVLPGMTLSWLSLKLTFKITLSLLLTSNEVLERDAEDFVGETSPAVMDIVNEVWVNPVEIAVIV